MADLNELNADGTSPHYLFRVGQVAVDAAGDSKGYRPTYLSLDMTRREAIDLLCRLAEFVRDSGGDSHHESFYLDGTLEKTQ